MKICKHVYKLIKNIEFLPNNFENMRISYKTKVKTKHTCSIAHQINNDIHTHTHTQEN